MSGRIAPKLFKEEEGATEEKGENARMSLFIGAIAIGDLIKSTLGPKGMDKILQSVSENNQIGKSTITNDGATILKSIPIDNAAAKILIDASKVQDYEVGDGTSTVVILASELLREAQKLIETGIHPQTIIKGYRMALKIAKDALLKGSSTAPSSSIRESLLAIAFTTLSSKILHVDSSHFCNIVVDAVMRLHGSSDLGHIHIIKKLGGTIQDSYLDDGFILCKQFGVGQPKKILNAKILVANTPMDYDKIKIYGAKVKVDSMAKVAEIEKAEKDKMKSKVERILSHKPTLFINRQLIYNWPESLFTAAGINSIEHADFEGVERLGLVTGAEIASTFDSPIRLGSAASVSEIKIGDDRCIKLSGLPREEACTIVLRGSSQSILVKAYLLLDESERSIHDALCVLTTFVSDSRIVLGAGCSEILMSDAIEHEIRNFKGKETLALASFCKALQSIPTILASNGGYDSIDLLNHLISEHHNGHHEMGLDLINGAVANVGINGLNIIESYKVKLQALTSAHEAAEMILRVDEVVKNAPRKREQADD